MKIKLSHIILTFFFILISCSNDTDGLTNDRVYIVGYDPCTIEANYRIGYVLVSENLQDTLITYNLSDMEKKIPASVLLNSSNTLYTIPEDYFINYRNSVYFPQSARFEFNLNIAYRIPSEQEMTFYLCKTDIPSLVAQQIIVETASK